VLEIKIVVQKTFALRVMLLIKHLYVHESNECTASASSSALHLSHWEFYQKVYILVPALTTFEPSASVSCTVHLVSSPTHACYCVSIEIPALIATGDLVRNFDSHRNLHSRITIITMTGSYLDYRKISGLSA